MTDSNCQSTPSEGDVFPIKLMDRNDELDKKTKKSDELRTGETSALNPSPVSTDEPITRIALPHRVLPPVALRLTAPYGD